MSRRLAPGEAYKYGAGIANHLLEQDEVPLNYLDFQFEAELTTDDGLKTFVVSASGSCEWYRDDGVELAWCNLDKLEVSGIKHVARDWLEVLQSLGISKRRIWEFMEEEIANLIP